MNFSVYQAAAAMNANLRWQEMIAENLNSTTIPGYKRQELSFEAVQAGLLKQSFQGANAITMEHSLPKAVATTSFLPGELRPSDSKTALAITGSGFFEVQLPGGGTAYTRTGEFRLTAQGQLVTKQGYPVLGEDGPMQLDTNNPNTLAISSAGEISMGGEVRGKLRLTEFNDPNLLTNTNGGYFVATDPAIQGRPAEGSVVHQGVVEGSNVSVVLEMANMLTAMRTFEANQRIIQMNDERTGRVLTDLGPT